MCCHAECWVEQLGREKGVTDQECAGHRVGSESYSVYFYCLCCVFSLSVSLLLLFILFTVLLNCPYPDPPLFCLFLSVLLPTPAGEGWQSDRSGPLLPATAKMQHLLFRRTRIRQSKYGVLDICLPIQLFCRGHSELKKIENIYTNIAYKCRKKKKFPEKC